MKALVPKSLRTMVAQRSERNNERDRLFHGQVLEQLQLAARPADIRSSEFQVFSQFGEDGALADLTAQLELTRGTFVEIGVESYRESNTRYLATRVRNPWRGVAVDIGDDHVHFLAAHPEAWKIDVAGVQCRVEPSNVNDIVSGTTESITPDLLSIDIDGMDYWVWEAVVCKPPIVVVEYNALFGPSSAVTVPYRPDWDPRTAVPAVYYGASLAALEHLAHTKGYTLVGTTSTSVNAFFVRDDLMPAVRWDRSSGTSWNQQRFANALVNGVLAQDRDPKTKLALVAEQPLVDIVTGNSLRVSDVIASL
jgi:hypothetical protein